MRWKSAILVVALVLSGVCSLWFWGAAWGQYVELGCDTMEVAITVRDNPERFDDLKFHRTDPKPFAEGLIAQHRCLGPLAGWGVIALVVFTASAVQLINLNGRERKTQPPVGGDRKLAPPP